MKLTVLCWNIHRAIGVDRRFRIDRIAEIIQHHNPDLIFLQEVDRGVPRSKRLWLDHELAKACGYPWHTWAEAHKLKQGSYGNATLSRLPIIKRRHLDLTLPSRKVRNAVFTRIQLPGNLTDLHTFNWHLGLSAKERRQQVKKLFRTGTYRSLPRKARVLLAGDTNDWRNRLFRDAIQSEGFDAWSEHGRRKPIPTFPAPAPVGALDKMFWRGALLEHHFHASKLKLARVASDHLPLVGEFDVVTESRTAEAR